MLNVTNWYHCPNCLFDIDKLHPVGSSRTYPEIGDGNFKCAL